MRRELSEELTTELERGAMGTARHVLQALTQTAALTGHDEATCAIVTRARQTLSAMVADRLEPLTSQRVLRDDAGGVELAPLIGAKAANLGEVRRILGDGKVPRWAAITARALEQTLEQALGRRGTLGTAIRQVLTHPNLPERTKAEGIQRLWSRARLPTGVRAAILDGCRYILAGDPECALAVRSSAFEEDTEQEAWAGQFATFLGVRGEDAVLDHVRRAWAGLWSAAVLERRQRQGVDPTEPLASGLVLQRLVDARVSGVLFTASPAAPPSKMVLNAGLGLGEGVVSGLSEVDLVLIDRPRTKPGTLKLDYKVADKRHRVTLAAGTSRRTRVSEVPYHQRLRPALEFVEIEELVATAQKLETALRHPLDIEFAFEGSHLHILQVRPVPVFHASLTSPLLQPPAGAASTPGDLP